MPSRLEFTQAQIRERLPHLWQVLQFDTSTQTRGMCFHRSVALMLDLPQARLLIATHRAGTPQEIENDPRVSPVPFLHCFTEIGDRVLSPSSYEAAGGCLVSWPRATYYEANGTCDTHTIPRAPLMAIAKRHDWPSHFLRGKPMTLNGKLPIVLLTDLKIPFRLSDRGGLLP